MDEQTKFNIASVSMAAFLVLMIVAFVVLGVGIRAEVVQRTGAWKASRQAECVQMLGMARTSADTLQVYVARSDCARVEK